MKRPLNQEQIEEDLEYLAETAESVGCLQAVYERKNYWIGIQEAICFSDAKGSAAERQKLARADKRYQEAVETASNARGDLEALRANRKAREIRIEVYRTLQANQRKGNI